MGDISDYLHIAFHKLPIKTSCIIRHFLLIPPPTHTLLGKDQHTIDYMDKLIIANFIFKTDLFSKVVAQIRMSNMPTIMPSLISLHTTNNGLSWWKFRRRKVDAAVIEQIRIMPLLRSREVMLWQICRSGIPDSFRVSRFQFFARTVGRLEEAVFRLVQAVCVFRNAFDGFGRKACDCFG